jgi:hypothetical protein
VEALLSSELTAVRREIEEFRAHHPHTAVEIVWRAVDGTAHSRGPAAEHDRPTTGDANQVAESDGLAGGERRGGR